MRTLRHTFGQMTSLVAAVLFLWLGAMHGAAKLEFAASPEALGYAAFEICGDGDETGATQHCPQCVVVQFAGFEPEITAPVPVQSVVLAPFSEPDSNSHSKRLWLRAPVRGPPVLT